jgi:hypothetical protein
MEGQIVVVQAANLLENKKLIPDVATWVQWPLLSSDHIKRTRAGEESAGVHGFNSQMQHEIQMAVLGGVRSEFPPGGSGDRP